jgi:type I restriction enzyme S subunit
VPRNLADGDARVLLNQGSGDPEIEVAALGDFGEFEVPPHWVWVRVRDIGRVVGGGTPPSGDADCFSAPGSDIPWLTPADLGHQRSRTYVSRGRRDITPRGLSCSGATLMPAGTVLFTSRAPIGYVAIAETQLTTNQGFKSIIPSAVAISGYVALYFRAFGPLIDSLAPGTTFREVSGKVVAGLPFPLPPLKEQHRIVAKVDELMALCDELDAAQTEREARRDRLRTTSLRNLVALDESKENARFFLRHSPRMITKPEHVSGVRRAILDLAVLGRLVQHVSEWMAVTPPRVCSLIVDGDHNPPPRQSRGVPHLTAKNVAGGKIRLDGCSYISEADFLITKKRYAPLVGDVLLTCVGTLGRTAIVPEGIVFSADRNLAALRPDPATCTSPFLKLVLDSPSAQRVIASASGQTAQPHIYLKDIRALEFMLPPLAEQDRIVAKVDELMVVCDELEQSLATEQTERGRLLDALLRDALEDALPARELELLGAR